MGLLRPFSVCVCVCVYRVQFVGGMGGFPPLWSMHPCLCWIIFIPGGDKMIRETHYDVPFWIKWFAECALKSHSESNDSRNALWSPILNQMIRNTRSDLSASKQWIIFRRNGLTDSEFQKAPLIMFFVRFLYNLFVVWITWKIKSLQLIGLTYNVFIKLWSH